MRAGTLAAIVIVALAPSVLASSTFGHYVADGDCRVRAGSGLAADACSVHLDVGWNVLDCTSVAPAPCTIDITARADVQTIVPGAKLTIGDLSGSTVCVADLTVPNPSGSSCAFHGPVSTSAFGANDGRILGYEARVSWPGSVVAPSSAGDAFVGLVVEKDASGAGGVR